MMTFKEVFRRNFAACIFGPLAIIPAVLIYALVYKIIDPANNGDQSGVVPVFWLVGLLVAYPVTLFIGLPIALILQKLDRFNLVTLLGFVFLIVAGFSLFSGDSFTTFLFILYYSTAVAVACWYFHKSG